MCSVSLCTQYILKFSRCGAVYKKGALRFNPVMTLGRANPGSENCQESHPLGKPTDWRLLEACLLQSPEFPGPAPESCLPGCQELCWVPPASPLPVTREVQGANTLSCGLIPSDARALGVSLEVGRKCAGGACSTQGAHRVGQNPLCSDARVLVHRGTGPWGKRTEVEGKGRMDCSSHPSALSWTT